MNASAEEYRQVRVTHRASADGETIGVHVFSAADGDRPHEGEAFLIDAIAVTEGTGAAGRPSAECDL